MTRVKYTPIWHEASYKDSEYLKFVSSIEYDREHPLISSGWVDRWEDSYGNSRGERLEDRLEEFKQEFIGIYEIVYD